MTRQASAIAINLSFVLHEPSDSPVVARYAKEIEQQRHGREREVSRLRRFTSVELGRRVILEGDVPRADQSRLRILSVRVGTWSMLDAVLFAMSPALRSSEMSTTFVDAADGQTTSRSLFRGMADLCLPPDAPTGESSDYFAAAILRPGNESIQLRFEPLARVAVQIDAGHSGWGGSQALIEKTIREFVLQWDCDRSLWSQPAELTLPEFEIAGRGGRGD